MNIRDISRLIKEENVEFVDFKFIDLPGQWQHYTIPVQDFSEDLFFEGIGFDGSSIRGFQPIEASDMLIKPDINTAFIDPFTEHVTLSFICNIKDPETSEMYSRDPRHVAMKAERYISGHGLADSAFFGPEAEFFVFDEIRFDAVHRRGNWP